MEMELRERTALCEMTTGVAFVGIRPCECTGLATRTKDKQAEQSAVKTSKCIQAPN
jgi:hypothetical protein